jgi:hypothetical protein
MCESQRPRQSIELRRPSLVLNHIGRNAPVPKAPYYSSDPISISDTYPRTIERGVSNLLVSLPVGQAQAISSVQVIGNLLRSINRRRSVNINLAMNTSLAGIKISDSKLARAITELVRDTETPLLFHHSSRVYYWGALAD